MTTTGLRCWSKTAATNSTADGNINFAEGMAPSAVNDSARALMASAAMWRDDNNATITTGGTSTAFTATSNQGLALSDGVTIKLQMNATSGASPTLNVDSLGAKAIQSVSGTAIPTGALLNNGHYQFTYRSSPDAWIVENKFAPNEFASGTSMVFYQDSAPTGWTTVTASIDDRALRVVSGSGAGGGTGGATGGSSAFTNTTLSALNMPNVTITVTDPGHNHSASITGSTSGLANGSQIQTSGSGTANISAIGCTVSSHVTNVTAAIDSTARGGAQTALAIKYASIIICTKA